MHFRSTSVEETRKLAFDMAQKAQPGDVILLTGDLGAGKTHFTQGFACGLGMNEVPTSPTFSLVCEYRDGRLPYIISTYTVLRTRWSSMISTITPLSRETEFPWWSGGISSRKRLLTTICCLIFLLMGMARVKSKPLPLECGPGIFFPDRAFEKRELEIGRNFVL